MQSEPNEGAVPAHYRIELWVFAAAVLVGLYHRAVYGWFLPFWLDETYTGTIAAQPTLSGLLRWCTNELSGPLYYFGIWAWEKVFGDSNFALRLPSALMSVAAIFLIATCKGVERRERFIWAALAAVWLKGLVFAPSARPQSLLFLLATFQAIAFLPCARNCTTKRLALWSLATSMLLLTHMHAAVISGLQFLYLLGANRLSLLKHWRALTIFLVPLAWLPIQIAMILKLMQPGFAGYVPFSTELLVRLPYDIFGSDIIGYVTLLLLVVLSANHVQRWISTREKPPFSGAEVMLAASGFGSIVLVIAIGIFKPSYDPRYFLPYMPATLFGLALLLSRTKLFGGWLPSAAIIAWTLPAAVNAWNYQPQTHQEWNEYEIERGSQWLMDRGERRILFIWLNPASKVGDPHLQSEMAGFFFRRAKYDAAVTAVTFTPADESAGNIADFAASRKAAVLWIDGPSIPDVEELPGFDCQRWGGKTSRSMACAPPNGNLSGRSITAPDALP